jgi:hypothetical protein
MGITLPEDGDLTQFTTDLVTFFLQNESEDSMATAEPESYEYGETTLVDLTDELQGGYVTISSDKLEGAFVVFMPADGIVALAYAVAAPGEYDDTLDSTLLAVAASLQYTATADDLMNALMGTSTPEATEEASMNSGGLDGEALVSERCTVCHSRDRIDKADKDEAGWTATVDRMIGNGAQLNADERQAVIDYLTSTH